MFRDLLAADPSRFFDSAGKQIPGLFEVNADTDSKGSWGFVQNDKIEIVVQMKFLNPVTRRSVDSAEEDSETVVITAGSTFKIRLQIVATDTPSGAAAKQEVAKTELAMSIADQAAATAKAAANAAAAQRTAAQEMAAAAAQTTATQERYTRAVDTNKKQTMAAAKALVASQAAQAALELAIATGKKETEIQAKRAAAVTAAALADNLQAIAEVAAAELDTAKLAADAAAATLAAAQTQAATALATVAAANAAAAKAAVMKADQEAADAASAKAAADAASDPLTKKIKDSEKLVLDPQTVVSLEAKLNEVKAERAAFTVTTDNAYADFIESVRKYDTSRSNLEYAISVGKKADDIQIFKAAAVSALSAKEKAELNAQATLSMLTSYYNLELGALQLTDKAKVDAATLASSVAAAGVNEATRKVNIATTAYTYASTVTGDAFASVADAQATLDARISGGAVFTEVQTRRKAVLQANSLFAASKVKSDAASAALADAQKALVAANAAAATASATITVVGATAANAETFYQSTIAAAKTYFTQKTVGANDNEKSLKAAALLTALNSAKDMVAAVNAAYLVSKRNFDVAIAAGKRLAEVSVLRQISQDAQLQQQRAGLILQKAETEFNNYAASLKESVSSIMGSAAEFQVEQIESAKINSLGSIYNSTLMYYGEVKAELDAAKAQDELAKSRLDNATKGGSTLSEIALLRQLKVKASSDYAAALAKHKSAASALFIAKAGGRGEASSQIFTTIAGTSGVSGKTDGSTKEGAVFGGLNTITFGPDGNIYVADTGSHLIRKVTPAGIVTTLAGNPGVYGFADGTGTNAKFYTPSGLAFGPDGNLYVADSSNHCIRKVTLAGVVTTIAGNQGVNGYADGTGTDALFNGPWALTVDASGDIYVADLYNQRIRKVTPAGVVTTVAGSGVAGFADGTGTDAQFFYPYDVAVNASGDIYVAEQASSLIRKISPAGVVTTFAGSTYGGANGTGTDATFAYPQGLAVDASGNIYVADTSNHSIRKITPEGVVTRLAGSDVVGGTPAYADGTGTDAKFSYPTGLTVAANGDIYVADSGNSLIRKVTPGGVVSRFVGSPGTFGYADGDGNIIRGAFGSISGFIISQNGDAYITDTNTNSIRKISPAGVITTIAGSGISGFADGTGTNAEFAGPQGLAVDASGNIYVADTNNQLIRKVTPTGVVTTIAGNPGIGGFADGTGTDALFSNPNDVAIGPDGNIYIADFSSSSIRKVTPGGVVTTLAGNPSSPGAADGTGTNAQFNGPYGLAVDANGDIYVSDFYNHLIRKVTPAGVVTTLAGSGAPGSADGTGADAYFNYPGKLSISSNGDIYISEPNNQLIRKVTPLGVVTTVAMATPTALKIYSDILHFTNNTSIQTITGSRSFATMSITDYTSSISIVQTTNLIAGIPNLGGSNNGTSRGAAFNNPNNITSGPDGNFYVADTQNHCIRKVTPAGIVTTFVGLPGNPGFYNETGTNATFNGPRDIAFGPDGNMYIGDTSNHRIRKVTPAGVVTTLAGTGIVGYNDGTGTNAYFNLPSGLAVGPDGNIYVADQSNHLIRKVTPAGVVTTIAGNPGTSGFADGTGTDTQFNYPTGLAVDASGNIYVADQGNHSIRKVTPAGIVTTLAGNPVSTGPADGTGTDAQFLYPYDVAIGLDGNIYVADKENHSIRKITPAGVVTTIAGNPGVAGNADGTGTDALFYNPSGLTVAANGDIYVADTNNQLIRKITPGGVVSRFVGSPQIYGHADGDTSIRATFNYIRDFAITQNGDIYVADTYNHCIRKISSSGVVTTIGGSTYGFADGTGTNSQFWNPCGVAVDTSGNIYVADTSSNSIRKVTPGGVVTTLAGNPTGVYGADNGTGTNATFNNPSGLAIGPDGNIYVADQGNQLIRKITPGGVVTTLAGSPTGVYGAADGTGTDATFWTPSALVVDANGNIYVADTGSNLIRKVTPTGVVTTFAGSGTPGLLDGTGTNANLYYPERLAIASNGDIYLADSSNQLIRKITPSGVVTTITNQLSFLFSVFILSNTLYWGTSYTINTVDAGPETTYYSTVTTSIVPVAGGSLENANVAAILSASSALRQSETLAAQQSEYVLETQKAYTELTCIVGKYENLLSEKDAIGNKLKTALEGGKTISEILHLQKQFAAKTQELSKVIFYNDAAISKYLSADTKGSPIQSVVDTLTDSMNNLISVGVQQKIDSASKDVSKAFVALNTARTEQAAAQGVYDLLNEEMNTAINQGKTMADAATTQDALNAATTDLANKTAATNYAEKAYKAAVDKYNLYQAQNVNLPTTFAMQGAEISTIMSTVTATANLSVSSINAAKNNNLTRNLTQTYSQMMQMSTMVQQYKSLYSTTTAEFNVAIDQGKGLSEIQGLRGKLQEISNNLSKDTSNLTNTANAYTSSLLVAVESEGSKSILDALALTQTKITEGAKANALLNTLIEAKEKVFALTAEDAAAQSELVVANSAIQIAMKGGDIPQEKYDAVLVASNKAAIIRKNLVRANTAMMNAQININMNPNVEAINALATTTYIKQNAKAESNTLMAQYKEAKATKEAADRDLAIAMDALQLATTTFDNAISSGTELHNIQNARDVMNAAEIQVKAANQAEKYAKDALELAIQNAKVNPVANSLIITREVYDDNALAGAKVNAEQYKLNSLNAELAKATAAAAAAATAATTARTNLETSNASAVSQEMVDLRSAADSAAAASDAAQTALDNMRRNVLEQKDVLDAATAAFQATQAALVENNIRVYMILNGFVFVSVDGFNSVSRYVLQKTFVPSTLTTGLSVSLETISFMPIDLWEYDPATNYTLGNIVSYPDINGDEYVCLTSAQDPRGNSFTTISGKDPVSYPTLWKEVEVLKLKYVSATDLIIQGATSSGMTISATLTGDLANLTTLFINSDISGNNTLLNGLTIFGPGIRSSTLGVPATISSTEYTNNRSKINITATMSFTNETGTLQNLYIKNGKTILSAAVQSYNTYIAGLVSKGLVPDVRLGFLTNTFVDRTKLPGIINPGIAFSVGTTSITPTDKGTYSASAIYTMGDVVSDVYTSKYICMVGPTSTNTPYYTTGNAPVESPGTSLYWFVLENRGWNTLTYNTATDINLQITGFGSILWTSPEYPPNTIIQVDSNFLQGYTLFGSGILERTTVISSEYAFANNNRYSYKLILDAPTSANLSDTFYVKQGSEPLVITTQTKLCEVLSVFMNTAATKSVDILNATTVQGAATLINQIVNPDIDALKNLYPTNTRLIPYINVATTVVNQCLNVATSQQQLVQLYANNQITAAEFNAAKTTNTTKFTAIQTQVTLAASAVNAQDVATATTKVTVIATQQSNVIADPTVKVYLLASDYSGTGAWTDKSGNGKNATLLTGTISKTTNSIVLNGTTAWKFSDVNVGNAWTASVWYKQTGTNGGNGYILTQGLYNSTNKVNLSIGRGNNSVANNNFNVFGFYNQVNNQTSYPRSINLDTNIWVNLQLTWNGTNLSLYRDGFLLQTVVSGGVSESSVLDYHIGYRQDVGPQGFVTGEIGEVRIFNRPLTATEVYKTHCTNITAFTGLIAWYNAADYSGTGDWKDRVVFGNKATVFFGTPSINTSNKSIVFNGQTSFRFSNVAVGNAWTVSVWYKKYNTATGSSVILSQLATAANNIFISDTSGNNTVSVGFKPTNDTTLRQTSGLPLTTDVWANILTTWNGTTLTTYLNGTLNSSSTPGGGVISSDNATPYILGSDFDGSDAKFIKGEIGDVRIYNKAISSTEISALYNTTLMSVTGLKAWLRASDYSGSGKWMDKTGSGYDATLENGAIAINADVNGITLNGGTSWKLPNLNLGNSWTIMVWYKITGAIGSTATILTQISSAGVNTNATLGYISGTNLTAGFANSNSWTNSGTIPLTTNIWTNIHATCDGANIRTYVNGVLSSTVSANSLQDNGLEYRIGGSWSSAPPYVIGEIGEIRIYNRPLTQYEIADEYYTTVGSYNFAVSNPSSLGNLRFWLDGDDPNATGTAPAVNSTLTTWKDKSTNAVTPTRSGSTTGLVYAGPMTGVLWNATSYLTLPTGTLPNGNSSFTYFFVVKSPNQNNTRLVNIGTTNQVGTQLGLHYRDSDMNFFQPDLTTTVPPANQINIIRISYNSTTRKRIISLNAATGATDTLASSLNLPTTSQIIGANTGGGEVINGNLYEVLVYSSVLTGPQRQGVEGYLAWKWGFQTTLPSTHPYRNAPLAAPSPPTGLTGSIITESAFTVSWTGGAQATSYTYTLNGVATTPTRNNGLTSKSAGFTGLSPLTQYTVIVTAVNAIGSVTSSSVSVTTIADLTVKAGLQMWLDAKDQYSMTITTGTSTVTAWRDKSAFNSNTTSVVGTPQLGVNGITFDSSSYFSLPSGCLPFNDTDFTMYIIVRSPSGNAGLLTAGNGLYIAYDVGGAKLGFQGFNGGGTYTNVSIQSALAIYTIRYSSSESYNFKQYINGTQSTNTNGTGPRNQTSTPNSLGIAAYAAKGMIVGEMIVYNSAHSTTQRQDVEGYLAWKWGIQATLPSNHPYRNSQPV
jgi:sugar lactone lactonase YvrE